MAHAHDGENGPEIITLWMVVPLAMQQAAERLAITYADEGAEEVCAAFVGVMAEAAERPDSLRAAWLKRWLASHPWAREGAPVPPELLPRLIPLDDLGDGDAAGRKEGA